MKRRVTHPGRAKADAEWQRIVKDRAGYACERCQVWYGPKSRGLHAAHIFSKGAHPATRHDPKNGIALCMRHHLYWAHTEPMEFAAWVLDRMGQEEYEALERRANGA